MVPKSTFSCSVNGLIFGLDAIIYSEEWEQHLGTIREFFKRLSDARQTINLPTSEFCHANLTFLGQIVDKVMSDL